MIDLSELKVIEDVFFRISLKYNKSSLYPFIEKNFSENKIFNDESVKKVKMIIDNSKDNLAHNVLLNKDFSHINKNIKKNKYKFNDKYWIEKLPDIKRKTQKHLGLNYCTLR